MRLTKIERKSGKKEEKRKKIKRSLIKKFRLRHTLEIFYEEENSAKYLRGGGGKKSNFSKNILP